MAPVALGPIGHVDGLLSRTGRYPFRVIPLNARNRRATIFSTYVQWLAWCQRGLSCKTAPARWNFAPPCRTREGAQLQVVARARLRRVVGRLVAARGGLAPGFDATVDASSDVSGGVASEAALVAAL